MAALEPASGPMIVTRAPRLRAPAASTAMAVCQLRASTRAAMRLPARYPAVGTRHSTWVPGRTGAMSRLAGLHTPPST